VFHPKTGEKFTSVLKTTGKPYTNTTVNVLNKAMSEVTIEPATQEEIHNTIQVMGGEDWQMWMQALQQANVLAENVRTVAYSYIGPEITHPMYRDGTIGKAKEHLEQTAQQLQQMLQPIHGEAYVAVNKAVVTQSSAAIPVVPLYISILYKVMQEKGCHEGCIEQIYRLFHERLYNEDHKVIVDEQGLIRVDDWEMRKDVQAEVSQRWSQLTPENLETLSGINDYQTEFYHLFGFKLPQVDYAQEVDPEVEIASLAEKETV
jgi:enoyl-[acyl-carrier protein] reductase/trans-2-enoyl-CoA reductase (NAD+)